MFVSAVFFHCHDSNISLPDKQSTKNSSGSAGSWDSPEQNVHEETVSLAGNQTAHHRPTGKSDGAAHGVTCDNAPAGNDAGHEKSDSLKILDEVNSMESDKDK